MANHKSARKSIRQDKKRNLINKSRKSTVRTFLKKVHIAISSGDQKVAGSALSTVQSHLAKGVNKGILKFNTAARKVSRLARKIKNMNSI